MSGCSPWNEKDEVRAATCSSLMRARELSSSSVSPSEKYSCSLSPLIFTNGSTAIECCGGVNAAAVAETSVAVWLGSAADVVGGGECLETQSLSTAMYASATASTAIVIHSPGFDPRGGRGDVVDAGAVVAPAEAAASSSGEASGTNSRLIRSTNVGGVSPPG